MDPHLLLQPSRARLPWGALRALAPCGNHRCMALFNAVHLQGCAVSCPGAEQGMPLQVKGG